YKICENGAVPENCDSTTVTILVENPIDAVEDDFTTTPLTGGDSTPDITDNDTLDGRPVVIGTGPGEITVSGVTVPSELTLNEDGTISIAEGAPSGTYTLVYKICENGAVPENCDSTTVTILVLNLSLDSDGDGVLDYIEIEKGTDPMDPCSYNLDDITEIITSLVDCDGDGMLDSVEISKGTNPKDPCDFIGINITETITVDTDCDGDGISTMDEDLNNNGDPDDDDSDGDGIPNYLDVDDDNDGVSTEEETAEGDCDRDGILNYLDPDSCEIIVHNLLTPNGDGKNDYLYITGIQSHPDNTLEIYNRWGVLVFKTKGYGVANRVFRGVSEGRVTMEVNKELPVGTYYYILVYTNSKTTKVVKKVGHLYINR
ncbi:MAG: gliding motility-associated C-terminal domain-containing protein, partial [Flavobacteriaceae bacterium]|nr:gliding motility-associated C-terminal domain-containing protein [Flavobacteriaceae bacterium]